MGGNRGSAAGLGSAAAAAVAAADIRGWAERGRLGQQAATTPVRAVAGAYTVVAASSVGVAAACPAAPRRKSFAEVGALVRGYRRRLSPVSSPWDGEQNGQCPCMFDRYIVNAPV